MLNTIKTLMSPKTRVRTVIGGIRPENVYFLQNTVRSWNIPGTMQTSGGVVCIELEGRAGSLRARMDELRRHSTLKSAGSVEITWLPWKGDFEYFSVIF